MPIKKAKNKIKTQFSLIHSIKAPLYQVFKVSENLRQDFNHPFFSEIRFFQLTSILSVFRVAELATTERELSAIAAAAIIGVRYPNAAMGTPIEL